MINNSYEKFFEEEGLICPICIDGFSHSDPEKYPSLLPCEKHDVCMSCLKKLGDQLKSCPLCRAPIKNDIHLIKPNSMLIGMIETSEKIWDSKSSQNNHLAAPSNPGANCSPAPIGATSVLPVELPQIARPKHFQCHSLIGFNSECKTHSEAIENSLHAVALEMKWSSVAAELQKDYYQAPHNWYGFWNHSKQEFQGIICIELKDAIRCEAHWSGLIKFSPQLYQELYKQVLYRHLNQVKGSQDWQNCSLTTYYNYDLEEPLFDYIVSLLRDHGIRHEITYLHKHWGTQIKLSAFPIPKVGHPHMKRLEIHPDFNLERNADLDSTKELKLDLMGLHPSHSSLSVLFRTFAGLELSPEQVASSLKADFIKNPENFYLYQIEDRFVGFVQFEHYSQQNNPPDYLGGRQPQSMPAAVKLVKCGMLPDCLKYAPHFLEEFVQFIAPLKLEAVYGYSRNHEIQQAFGRVYAGR